MGALDAPVTSVRPSGRPSVRRSVKPSICRPGADASGPPCVLASVYPAGRQTVSPSVRPSVQASVRQTVRSSVRPPHYPPRPNPNPHLNSGRVGAALQLKHEVCLIMCKSVPSGVFLDLPKNVSKMSRGSFWGSPTPAVQSVRPAVNLSVRRSGADASGPPSVGAGVGARCSVLKREIVGGWEGVLNREIVFVSFVRACQPQNPDSPTLLSAAAQPKSALPRRRQTEFDADD